MNSMLSPFAQDGEREMSNVRPAPVLSVLRHPPSVISCVPLQHDEQLGNMQEPERNDDCKFQVNRLS